MLKPIQIAYFIAALLCLFPLSQPAQAYLVGSLTDAELDMDKETHLLVVGFGREMGTQFLESAVSAARRLQESFPQRQYLFIQQRDKNSEDELRVFKQYGIRLISANTKPLMGATVVKFAQRLNHIASIEIFSHGHSVFGAALSGNEPEQRFYQGTPELETLKGHFTKYGYLVLHGCNAGFVSAPKISNLLEIPVAGHLTGSNFQQPFSDKHWYFNDDGLFPKTEQFAKINEISFADTMACRNGNCSRLVADPHPYHGDFGVHKVGLGFRKFYCNYDHGNECYAAMATALLGLPSERDVTISSSTDDQLFLAKDLLCPIDPKRVRRENCLRAIEDSAQAENKELKFFSGQEPVCDLSGCKIKTTCNGRNCTIVPTETAEVSTNLMTEYFLYQKGFALLRAEQHTKKKQKPVQQAPEAPETKVIAEEPKSEPTKTGQKPVEVKEAPQPEATKETPAKLELVQEAPKPELIPETPPKLVPVQEAPKPKIVKEAPKPEVVKEAPKAEKEATKKVEEPKAKTIKAAEEPSKTSAEEDAPAPEKKSEEIVNPFTAIWNFFTNNAQQPMPDSN